MIGQSNIPGAGFLHQNIGYGLMRSRIRYGSLDHIGVADRKAQPSRHGDGFESPPASVG